MFPNLEYKKKKKKNKDNKQDLKRSVGQEQAV